MGSKLAAFLVFVTLVFQHFQIFTVLGYEVTIGALSGILMVIIVLRKLNFGLAIPVWATLAALTSAAALFAGETDATGYLSTLALFLLSSLIVSSAFGEQKWEIYSSAWFACGMLIALMAIVALSLGQVVLGYLGSDMLFNPFGDHQYLHKYQANIGLVEVPRAHGFFLEPSYDAFVIGAITATLISLGKFVRTTAVLCVLGLIACQSATGLVLLVAIAALIALRSRPAIALGAVAVVGGVIIFTGEYLLVRLASSGTEGSSAYYRIIAPLQVISDVLQTHPLGMPLGSIEKVIGSYGLEMAGVQAKSLDNGFYVVVFYFGWLGLILLLLLLYGVLKWASRTRMRGYAWIAPLWLFSSLFFSGGIMAPEFALMSFLAISSYRISLHESAAHEHTDIEHYYSHI
jgi:putative colanic acid polymerase